MSPYGQPVFADAVDAIQAVDLCYDAMMSEIDNGKMRVFLSDVMFDIERDGKGGRVSIPFGKADYTVFRKVMSTEDTIHEFAPTLRTEAQARAFRVALQTPGDRERGRGGGCAPTLGESLSAPARAADATRRARPGSSDWAERVDSGQ